MGRSRVAQRRRDFKYAKDYLNTAKLQFLHYKRSMYTGIFHITFHMDPGNPDGSIINSNQELDNLAELLDVGSKEIEHCLTFKTVTAVSDKYEVPLKASDAKATCDAFSAHKCSYIGQKSYM